MNFLRSRVIALILIPALLVLCVGCDDDNSHDFGENNPDLYVAFGNSITYGFGLPAADSYPLQLSVMLGKTVINVGAPGETSSGGAARVNGILLRHKPGYLLVLYGANDIIHGENTDVIIANLRTIVRAAQENDTIPIIATLTPTFDLHEFMAGAIEELNELIRELAAEEGIIVADLESVFGNTADYMLDDGLHPNSDGAKLIASTFRNVL